MVRAGLSALGGVAAALLVWLCQGYAYYGSWGESLANILGAAGSRISISDGAVRQGVTIPGVLAQYFVADATPALRLGGWQIPLGPLLAAVLALALATAALLLALRRRDLLRGLAPAACLWVLAVLAPASWLVLSKAHSDVHRPPDPGAVPVFGGAGQPGAGGGAGRGDLPRGAGRPARVGGRGGFARRQDLYYNRHGAPAAACFCRGPALKFYGRCGRRVASDQTFQDHPPPQGAGAAVLLPLRAVLAGPDP